MSARVVAVTNLKGGAGKSTLAMLLAGALAETGSRVLVADADPQNTAVRWAANGGGFPARVEDLSAEEGRLHKALRKRLDAYDYVVIDTPPQASAPVIDSALRLARLALVPVIPSPPDLWASLRTRAAIEQARGRNPGLAARVVVNQLQLNTLLAQEVLALLPQFGIPLMAAQLKSRTAYRQAAAQGTTVRALGARAAIASLEIEALAREVRDLLG
ncbi:MAG: ParA family protein [Thiobacillaceae bacterium]|nr:ParA family protein [Thiobacillaceae bacterium]MCX7673335.1 ParA family protein [Thiobacillaceae bacterium]MDW8322705.1 ParA family partition ATPase [Burkholderiales bacterium]